jgi:hypothetical protein
MVKRGAEVTASNLISWGLVLSAFAGVLFFINTERAIVIVRVILDGRTQSSPRISRKFKKVQNSLCAFKRPRIQRGTPQSEWGPSKQVRDSDLSLLP